MRTFRRYAAAGCANESPALAAPSGTAETPNEPAQDLTTPPETRPPSSRPIANIEATGRMAIFHLSAKVISRGKGQSAIAAAAYRSGERLYDEQAAQQKYYPSRDERIVFTDIMAPKDAPEWAHDRDELWNRAERAEKRKDAQLAREIEVSLPHELNDRQREWLIKDFARETFVRNGYAVDIAIHAPDRTSDDRNYHAHLMVTMRTLGPEGFAAKKDPEMNRREQLGEWREKWAHLANRHLERHGHEARIDHRSLKEQGIDREATVHLGYAANEMTQRGAQSDKMDALRDILARNEIRVDMKAIERELKALENEEAKQQRAHAAERAAAEKAKQAAPQPTKERQAKAKPEATRTVPIEDINARHAAAEIQRQQSEAEKQQRKDMAALARAARSDEAKLRAPAPGVPSFERSVADAAREEAQTVRVERRNEKSEADQQAWKNRIQEREDRQFKYQVKARGKKAVRTGLQVADRATGATMSLVDFVSNFLAGSSAQPAEPKADMRAFVTDPAARKTQQLGRLAAAQREKESDQAIESIREDMEAGRNLKPENIASLTRQHQEQIRSKGDSYAQEMVDDARKRADTYWKGRERGQD